MFLSHPVVSSVCCHVHLVQSRGLSYEQKRSRMQDFFFETVSVSVVAPRFSGSVEPLRLVTRVSERGSRLYAGRVLRLFGIATGTLLIITAVSNRPGCPQRYWRRAGQRAHPERSGEALREGERNLCVLFGSLAHLGV